jgi:putative spermidine/putrescine transport system permease protein
MISGSMSSARRDRVGGLGLLLFLAIAIVPLGASLLYAGLYSVGLTGLLNTGFTLDAWRRVLGGREVWASLALSAGVALAVVVLAAAGGLALALALRGRPGGLDRGALSYALYLPLALPGTVAALFTFQMLTGGGLVPRLLLRLAVLANPEAYAAPVQDRWAIGIVLTHAALAVPFFALLFAKLHKSERIDELSTLAASLGASGGQRLRRVEIPLLLRAAASNLALLFVVVLGSYEIPLLLGRQAPQMLSVLTLRKYALFDIHQKPEAFVVALLYTALVLGVIAVVFWRGREDVS